MGILKCFIGKIKTHTQFDRELIPNMNLETRQNSSVAMLLDENNKEPVFHEYNHYKTGGLANLLLSKGER